MFTPTAVSINMVANHTPLVTLIAFISFMRTATSYSELKNILWTTIILVVSTLIKVGNIWNGNTVVISINF